MNDLKRQEDVQHRALPDEAATLQLGGWLAEQLQLNYAGTALVFLRGQLGAGKTTLVRGMLAAMGHTGVVKSPTYTLLEPYEIGTQQVFHFDLYRVHDPQELEFVGIDEIVDGPGLKLFEWPEQAEDWLPAADVTVELEVVDAEAGGRLAHVHFR
ncbi:MAG: tRNA (adenosine(37)-N6)-threonylcarbamoyltransferase complex ATPase subunit type 1 TsaE [Pseudomonadota bacterium]